MAAPRVAAGRQLLQRQRVSSVQVLVWALVSCAACASLSAALPSVAACYTVRVFELGSTYILDIPKLLSCGHPIAISPEELSCFAVNTDATARDSAVWIHTDVLDLVHSLVGGGATLHSAAATRMTCRASEARVSAFVQPSTKSRAASFVTASSRRPTLSINGALLHASLEWFAHACLECFRPRRPLCVLRNRQMSRLPAAAQPAVARWALSSTAPRSRSCSRPEMGATPGSSLEAPRSTRRPTVHRFRGQRTRYTHGGASQYTAASAVHGSLHGGADLCQLRWAAKPDVSF